MESDARDIMSLVIRISYLCESLRFTREHLSVSEFLSYLLHIMLESHDWFTVSIGWTGCCRMYRAAVKGFLEHVDAYASACYWKRINNCS